MVIENTVELETFEDDELHGFVGINESFNREIQARYILQDLVKNLAIIRQDFLTFLTKILEIILQELSNEFL